MAEFLTEAEEAQDRFKGRGDMVIRIVKDYPNRGTLGRAENQEHRLQWGRYQEAGCESTKKINTGHRVLLERNKRGIEVEIPDELVSNFTPNQKSIKVFMVIKYLLETTDYKYFENKDYFRITHRGPIEEMSLYVDLPAMRNNDPFLTLTESELY